MLLLKLLRNLVWLTVDFLCSKIAAFETIYHGILCISRLTAFGVSGPQLVKILQSDRTQCISCNNTISAYPDVKYGVPRGSVLVPCLYFTSYPNYLQSWIKFSLLCWQHVAIPVKTESAAQIMESDICLLWTVGCVKTSCFSTQIKLKYWLLAQVIVDTTLI